MTDFSNLSKTLLISDLYRYILDVPGVIVHVGSPPDEEDLVLWQSLREIYEPHSDTRQIIMIKDCFPEPIDGQSIQDRLMSIFDTGPFIIALIYFDICDQKETAACLGPVANRLTRGSILAFSMEDEGQITAICDVLGLGGIRLQSWHPCRNDCFAII